MNRIEIDGLYKEGVSFEEVMNQPVVDNYLP